MVFSLGQNPVRFTYWRYLVEGKLGGDVFVSEGLLAEHC